MFQNMSQLFEIKKKHIIMQRRTTLNAPGLANSIPKVLNEDTAMYSEGSTEDQTDSKNHGIRTTSRTKKFPNTMGIKSDKAVYESSTPMIPKHHIYQGLEVCAVKLYISSFIFCVLCVYRSPSGNFSYFLSSLEPILNQLYANSINIIICGDKH
jgi:hypothetical protein